MPQPQFEQFGDFRRRVRAAAGDESATRPEPFDTFYHRVERGARDGGESAAAARHVAGFYKDAKVVESRVDDGVVYDLVENGTVPGTGPGPGTTWVRRLDPERMAAEDPFWKELYPHTAEQFRGLRYYPYDVYAEHWDQLADAWDRTVLRKG